MSGSKVESLQDHVLASLHALDAQIARAMQRTPKEREEHGVEKWKPIQERVEKVTEIVLQGFADERCKLDGILVLSEAMVKSLRMLIEELEKEGLGEVRSHYCEVIFSNIEREVRTVKELLTADKYLQN